MVNQGKQIKKKLGIVPVPLLVVLQSIRRQEGVVEEGTYRKDQ